jgi:predicted DNA-binding transcriptional regulator AlpA
MDAQHTADNPRGLEPLIDVNELAGYLGLPVSTIYDWRTRGLGPTAYRFGKHLKYAVSDVRVWVEQQRDVPTSAGRAHDESTTLGRRNVR